MELRSYNVERVFLECLLSESTPINNPEFNSEKLANRKEDIVSMLDQIQPTNFIPKMHLRKDEEIWTSSLQIIKMLVTLGEAIGYLTVENDKIRVL